LEGLPLTYEQIGDELYIVLGDTTIGRILDQGADNYYVCFEDSDYKTPVHSLDNAKRFVVEFVTKSNHLRLNTK
jgi:hypothetical protein